MRDLWFAARYGDIEKMRELLVESESTINCKSDIEWRNRLWFSYTPLIVSSIEGHLACVELLLKAGADSNCRSLNGSTPLYMASCYNQQSVVSALLAAGAQVDVTNNDGWNPLIMAAYYGHSEVVKLLLDAGANKEFKTKHGQNALEVAIKYNKEDVVKVFKEHEHLERVVRPAVVEISGLNVPHEIAELCGDFIVVTPERRAIEARTRRS